MYEVYPFYHSKALAFHIIYLHPNSKKDKKILSNLPDVVLKDTRKKWLQMLESENPFFKINRKQIIQLYGIELLKNPRAQLLFYNTSMFQDNQMSKGNLKSIILLSYCKWLGRNQYYSWNHSREKFYIISKEFLLTRFYYPKEFNVSVQLSTRAVFESALMNRDVQEEYLSLYCLSTNMFYLSRKSGMCMYILCEGFSPKMIIIL